MIDFYSCANCREQRKADYALQDGTNLFCTYKCHALFKAGIPPLRPRFSDKAKDEEFERVARLARRVC